MFCNKCGNQFPDGVKYCPKCGNKIDGNDEQTKNNTAQQIEQPAVQTVEQQVAQQTKANEANAQNGVNVQNANITPRFYLLFKRLQNCMNNLFSANG